MSDSEQDWSRAGQHAPQTLMRTPPPNARVSPDAWWDRDETVQNVIVAAVRPLITRGEEAGGVGWVGGVMRGDLFPDWRLSPLMLGQMLALAATFHLQPLTIQSLLQNLVNCHDRTVNPMKEATPNFTSDPVVLHPGWAASAWPSLLIRSDSRLDFLKSCDNLQISIFAPWSFLGLCLLYWVSSVHAIT